MLHRFFLLPAVLGAATIGYMVLNPSGSTVATPPPADTQTPTITATPTPELTSTAVPTATPSAEDSLPHGLTGRLTYRTGDEFVTVQFPGAAIVQRFRSEATSIEDTEVHAGWRAEVASCGWTGSCEVLLSAHDVAPRRFRTDGVVAQIEVSHDGSSVAFTTAGDGAHPIAYKLWIVDFDDPGGATPRLLHTTSVGSAHPFAWTADGEILIASNTEFESAIQRVEPDGDVYDVAFVAAPVWYLYPSPEGRQVAYTQNSIEGWRLHVIDAQTGAVADMGNMGSDQPGGRPPEEGPVSHAGKGPMHIAWSPDASMLAFGGGWEPPYTMTVVHLGTGTRARTEFSEGYPGEIEWSADGKRIAVSTYDTERTRHETYVVDPLTGEARHLLSGCVIVWSPDGRFLAVHGEAEPGVAMADVQTGHVGRLTRVRDDTPLRWLPDPE